MDVWSLWSPFVIRLIRKIQRFQENNETIIRVFDNFEARTTGRDHLMLHIYWTSSQHFDGCPRMFVESFTNIDDKHLCALATRRRPQIDGKCCRTKLQQKKENENKKSKFILISNIFGWDTPPPEETVKAWAAHADTNADEHFSSGFAFNGQPDGGRLRSEFIVDHRFPVDFISSVESQVSTGKHSFCVATRFRHF